MKNILKIGLIALILASAPPAAWADDDAQECIDLFTAEKYQAAFPVCKRIAEQGDPFIQAFVGSMHSEGKGVQQDKKQAIKWYHKAAEQGLDVAQFFLALMHYNGEGTVKNYREAVKWYRKAAEQGYADAQNNLGSMYYNGEGVVKNYREAVKWYHKAAVLGHAGAQNNLAFMYGTGKGVNRNLQERYVWLLLAASQEQPNALESISEVEKELTSTQINVAQAEAARRATEFEFCDLPVISISDSSPKAPPSAAQWRCDAPLE